MSISRRLRKRPPMLGISVVVAVLKIAIDTTNMGQGVPDLISIGSNLHLSDTKLIDSLKKSVGGGLTKRK